MEVKSKQQQHFLSHHVCVSVVLPHEPHASHKIQLWKTRDLYSRLTTATHTNICGVRSHLLVQTAQSARCVCLRVNVTYLRHKPLSSLCARAWFLRVCAARGWECCLSVKRNVSQQNFSALSLRERERESAGSFNTSKKEGPACDSYRKTPGRISALWGGVKQCLSDNRWHSVINQRVSFYCD